MDSGIQTNYNDTNEIAIFKKMIKYEYAKLSFDLSSFCFHLYEGDILRPFHEYDMESQVDLFNILLTVATWRSQQHLGFQ